MRTICEACFRAPAALFCAADEAALCRPCDHKVHVCNKLASRHVRVGLADPSEAPRCDICENAPAFFYCEIDGSSLCLQCDMIVHVGGKRTHGRYLVCRQRIVFPGDKPCHVECHAVQSKEQVETENDRNKPSSMMMRENSQDERHSTAGPLDGNNDDHGKFNSEMIDLNMKPHQPTHAQASNRQVCRFTFSSPWLIQKPEFRCFLFRIRAIFRIMIKFREKFFALPSMTWLWL